MIPIVTIITVLVGTPSISSKTSKTSKIPSHASGLLEKKGDFQPYRGGSWIPALGMKPSTRGSYQDQVAFSHCEKCTRAQVAHNNLIATCACSLHRASPWIAWRIDTGGITCFTRSLALARKALAKESGAWWKKSSKYLQWMDKFL